MCVKFFGREILLGYIIAGCDANSGLDAGMV
jgi:hypothetical protein